MAGGTQGDIRSPFPKGEDALFWVPIPVHMIAGVYDEKIVWQWTLPFACQVHKATITAYDIISTGTVQMTLKDDTGTPKEAFDNSTIAAITAGAGTEQNLSPDKSVTFFAGAILKLYLDTTNAADAILSGCVMLGLKPIH